MFVSTDRAALRRFGRDQRRAITGAPRTRAELLIAGHLHRVIGPLARCVGAFVAHDSEPSLAGLVAELWANAQSVALPVMADDADDYTMHYMPWEATDTLTPGRYGIPVPPPRPAVSPDVLLVSLTAFDRFGNRIGRGGGFFDRYLASYPGHVIGVGFEAQRVAKVPMDHHDEPLPVMVTELGVRYFAS